MSRSSQSAKSRVHNRTRIISWALFVLVAGFVLTVVGYVGGGALMAASALNSALPLASQAQAQLTNGDSKGVSTTVEQLVARTERAESATDTWAWRLAEGVPFVGSSLETVRELARVTNGLASDALAPLASIDLAKLRPADGNFDLVALSEYTVEVQEAADAMTEARQAVDNLPNEASIGKIEEAKGQLSSLLEVAEPALQGASVALPMLPDLLGINGPRNYLLLVQNNAEARGAGGIPSAMLLLTADQGNIAISMQAGSRDFNNARDTPIVPLSPEVVELYDDKVGRYIQDVTSMPDFALSAELARAYWAESFGTPIDSVMSIDPVALSYLLVATGPITLANGDVINSENAVRVLLSDVYARFPITEEQDAYFASAADLIFQAVASGNFDLPKFFSAMNQIIEERRLLFTPYTDEQRAALAGSRVLGELPVDNADSTTIGVYVNDLTEGKMNFYTDMTIAVGSDQCVSDTPTFTTTVTYTNGIDPAAVPSLPDYVHTSRKFPRGIIGTDVMLYGPVGATFESASIDGTPLQGVTVVTHLGRPAVRMNFTNDPLQTRSFTVVWRAAPGEFGPLTVANTPMVNPVPIYVETPGCG